MFCSNCGKEISDDITFCPACGIKLPSKSENSVQQVQEVGVGNPDSVISDKFLWALATVPMFLSMLLESFVESGTISETAQLYSTQGLCIGLIYADWRMLKECGKQQSIAMLIVGALIPLVYMFWRPYKTTKNFMPGIISCALSVAVLLFLVE